MKPADSGVESALPSVIGLRGKGDESAMHNICN